MRHARFDSQQRRSGLVAMYPMADAILGGGHGEADPTVAACARRLGLPAAIVLDRLADACRAAMPDHTARDWTQEPISELIDFLERAHHPYLVIELGRLGWLIRRGGAASAGMADRMQRWTELKLAHIAHEERRLFPFCRGIDRNARIAPAAEAALREMFSSHDRAGSELAAICDAYAGEIGAGVADGAAAGLLLDIVGVLSAHVELEDTVLLPVVVFAGEVSRSQRHLQRSRERLRQARRP